MYYKFIICLVLMLLASFVQGQELIQPGPPDSCFKTKSIHRIARYHKDVPSPEESDFPECQSWKESSCCTLALAEELSHRRTGGLYNSSRDLCGTISPGCAKYLRGDDCFYWCEPMLKYFQTEADGNIHNVPICMDYCDAWFEACKDDYTCFENNLQELDSAFTLTNCSAPYTCRTFREVYGNGKGLCDTIWGTIYTYSTDADNCTVMIFDSSMPNPNFKLTFPRSSDMPNPNFKLTFPKSSDLSKRIFGLILMHISALLFILLVTADIF